MQTLKKTALNEAQHNLKARMVDFIGWQLPVWYTSILEEHRAVRTAVGIFDVSHMGRVWVSSRKAGAFLDRLVSRPARALDKGQAQLAVLLLENGGIIDDLMVGRLDADKYLVVWNAGNIPGKLEWARRWAGADPEVVIQDRSQETVMIAVQGPGTAGMQSLKSLANLPRFGIRETKINGVDIVASRTGYTGEDGFEIIVEAAKAAPLWESFIKEGAKPCGLGARDSLRLEAGMLLYGQDMDTNTNPFEAGLGWMLDFNTDFIGRDALLKIKEAGIKRKLVGFRMLGREIARHGHKIYKDSREVGVVTSGGPAPSLGFNIGLGYVPTGLAGLDTEIDIMIREQPAAAKIVPRQFYRRKK